jgi:hypothetical protein
VVYIYFGLDRYMNDTIKVFGNALSELQRLWQESVRPLLSAKVAHSVEVAPKAILGVGNDAAGEAAKRREIVPEINR